MLALFESLFDEGGWADALYDDKGYGEGVCKGFGEGAVFLVNEGGIEDDIFVVFEVVLCFFDDCLIGGVDVVWAVEAGVEGIGVFLVFVDAGLFFSDDVCVDEGGLVVDGDFLGEGGFTGAGEAADEDKVGSVFGKLEIDKAGVVV